MTEATTATIVEVPFDGDKLAAVRDEGEVWLVVKRICEALGVRARSQYIRLKASPWSLVSMVETKDALGRPRSTLCIPLKRLSMWLATFDASRVAPVVRPKIERYQAEAADALHAYFYGRNALREVAPAAPPVVDEDLREALREVRGLRAQLSEFELAHSMISKMELRLLSGHVTRIAELEVPHNYASMNSARAHIYNELRAVVGWGGSGCAWRFLPADKVPVAFAVLRRREARVRKGVRAELRQLELPGMASRHGLRVVTP